MAMGASSVQAEIVEGGAVAALVALRDAESQSNAAGTLGILANNRSFRKGVLAAASISIDEAHTFKMAQVRYTPAPLAKLAMIESLELCTEPKRQSRAGSALGARPSL